MSNSEITTKHDIAEGGMIGVVGGGIIGAFAGGPVGAIIGAIVGGAASAGATSILDQHNHGFISPEQSVGAGDAAFVLPNPYVTAPIAYPPVAHSIPLDFLASPISVSIVPTATDAAIEKVAGLAGHMATLAEAEDTRHHTTPTLGESGTEMVLPWVE